MPDFIEGFSQVEYLLIFNAIIFGAIASEYFSGWGGMLRNRDSIKFNSTQLIWSIYAFLLLIQNWVTSWPRAKYINDNLLYFYFGLIPLLLFYLMSSVMFPSLKSNIEVDLNEHYNKNSRTLFILYGTYLFFTIIGSIVYLDKDLGDVTNQNLLRLAGLILCVFSGYYNKNKKLHYIFLGLNFIGLILFIFNTPS